MSFYSEIRANEQARSTGGGFNAADLVEDVKQNLYFIGQNLATLRKSTKTLGTPKDSIILRQNMYLRSDFRNKTIDSTRNLCKETGIKIKQLATVGTQENVRLGPNCCSS